MTEQKPVREHLEKIVKEFQEAGASKWTAVKIIKELENQKLSDKKLKEQAFELLKTLDQQAAEVYDSFQKMQVYNSQEVVKPFDRGNIIHSLLKETSLSRTIAEKIGVEVENKLKDLNLEYLNTSLIREIVSVKLLEYGQEKAHQEYTRVGMPVFEVQNNLKKTGLFSKEVLREYNWLKTIPKKIRKLHFKSIIHLTAVHDFFAKPFSQSFYFEPKTGLAEKQVIELGAKIREQQKSVSKGIFVKSLNNSFAQALENVSGRKMGLLADLVLMQLNNSFRYCQREGNFVSLDLFDSGEFKQTAAQKERAVEFAQKLVKNHGLNKENCSFSLAVAVDSKYKLKLLEENQKKGLYYLNCLEKNISLYPFLVPLENAKGISTFVGVNFPKIAMQSLDADIFEEKLSEISLELCKLFKLREEKLPRQKELVPAIGLYGLMQAANIMEVEKNFEKFFDKIQKALQKNCDEKTVITDFQDNVGVAKFAKENKKESKAQPFDSVEKTLLEKQFRKVFYAKNQSELETLFSKKAKAVYWENSASSVIHY